MELDVGPVGVAARRPEAARLEQGRGDRPCLVRQILQARQSGPVRLEHAVIGVIAGTFGDDVEVEMVLQVGADARQVVHRRDADRPQMIGRPDPGEQQQARRADSAGGEHHLAFGRSASTSRPPALRVSTPTARPFSTTMRVTGCAGLDREVRRSRIGRR